MTRLPHRPIDPFTPAPAPPPLPLDYSPRPIPRQISLGLLLAGVALFVGSLVFGAVGTYVVLRVGRDARYSLLSAVIAPIIFAAGLGGFLHSMDMVRDAARRPTRADRSREGPADQGRPPPDRT